MGEFSIFGSELSRSNDLVGGNSSPFAQAHLDDLFLIMPNGMNS